MACTPHPTTRLAEDLYSAKRAIARLIRADGTVTSEEAQIEQIVERLHQEAAEHEARRVYADAFVRCGPTPYTTKLARASGWHVIDGGRHEPPHAA